MRRLAWKTSMLCLTLAGWTALIAALAPDARSADGWTWPVRGEVLTRYANDEANPYAGGMHRGIDIAAPVGATVVAAHSGEITYAGALGYSGITIAVRSDDGRYVASYLHLSAVSVRRGEQVSAGQRVGTVGMTGRRSVDQPHLHFGVRLAGEEDHYVDPLTLLSPLGEARSEPPVSTAPATVPVATRPEPVKVPARSRVRAQHPLVRPKGVPVHAGLRRAPVGAPAPVLSHRARATTRRVRVGGPSAPHLRRPLPHLRTGVIAGLPAAEPAVDGGHGYAVPLAALGGLVLALGAWAVYRRPAPGYFRRIVTLSR